MGISYEDACERGYDGPPPGWRPRASRCADGMCGAEDCDTCHPGCEPDEEEEEEMEHEDEAGTSRLADKIRTSGWDFSDPEVCYIFGRIEAQHEIVEVLRALLDAEAPQDGVARGIGASLLRDVLKPIIAAHDNQMAEIRNAQATTTNPPTDAESVPF